MSALERPLPQAVLFACNLNSVRSPMAALIFRDRFGRRCYVDSCGVRAGETDPLAATVLEEFGLSLSGFRPKTFDDLEETSFDLVISLTPEAHHRALEMTRSMAVDVEYWPTYDPTLNEGSREQRLAEYRAVRDELDRRILDRFKAWSTY
jgi:protein-tyrosine-phosphatase